MKRLFSVMLITLLLVSFTSCGKQEPSIESPTQPELLLVETKPATAPTVPETEAPETLPAFLATAPTLAETTTPAETQPPTPSLPKPEVTKHPTPESVISGEEAWFVAHADGADGVRWWFAAPDSQEKNRPQELLSRFPNLKIEGEQQDTLVLKSIPPELNGWAVQAEFYNASGSSYTEAVVLSVTEAPKIDAAVAYASVLENCRLIQQYNPNTDSAAALAQNDWYQLADGLDLLAPPLGYALQDLDGNGIPELILGCTGSNAFGERGGDIIYALFTLNGESPTKLLQSWVRNRHYLCGDNRIYQEGSSSSASSIASTLLLKGNHLDMAHCLWRVGDPSVDSLSFYHTTDGTMNETEASRISQRTYDQLSAQLLELPRVPLPRLTPIS